MDSRLDTNLKKMEDPLVITTDQWNATICDDYHIANHIKKLRPQWMCGNRVSFIKHTQPPAKD